MDDWLRPKSITNSPRLNQINQIERSLSSPLLILLSDNGPHECAANSLRIDEQPNYYYRHKLNSGHVCVHSVCFAGRVDAHCFWVIIICHPITLHDPIL